MSQMSFQNDKNIDMRYLEKFSLTEQDVMKLYGDLLATEILRAGVPRPLSEEGINMLRP